jgi:hypothetical protein
MGPGTAVNSMDDDEVLCVPSTLENSNSLMAGSKLESANLKVPPEQVQVAENNQEVIIPADTVNVLLATPVPNQDMTSNGGLPTGKLGVILRI